jgi:hypothetical protein
MFPVACVPKSLPGKILLLGNGEKSWDAVYANSTFYYQRFLSIAGTTDEVRIKCNGSGTAKVAIYSDNVAVPNTLLAYSEVVTVASGWNAFYLNVPVTLTATYYWLCVNTSVDRMQRIGTGGTVKRTNPTGTIPIATAFPNPADLSALANSSLSGAIAAWGR